MNELLQPIIGKIGEPGGIFYMAWHFIDDRFGTPGLIAAGILLISLIGLVLMKTVKLSFDIVRYVAVPAIAITFIATYFLPYSFVYILPVTVAFFSIILIVKG